MNQPVLTCQSERRRDRVRGAENLFGLDYLEVSYPDPNRPLIPTLTVYFLGRAPIQGQAPGQISEANLRIEGGRRIRDIKVTSLVVHQQQDETLDDFMEVTVDRDGDFSTYTMSVVELDKQGHPAQAPMSGFDPRYASIEFSFKAGCPSDLDCKTDAVCPPEKRDEPEINYLAKDYASFRQLILDRLALIMPDWQERHVPDIGIALVEVLAYVGDYLSYYQDAVATEAYLDTARQRISVRRHARLVDYEMHEGCNARAWVTIDTDEDVTDSPPKFQDIYFTTASNDGRGEVFEPLVKDPKAPLQLYAAHSTIYFYTWGDTECCLPKGATRATLQYDWRPAKQPVPKPPPYQQTATLHKTAQYGPPPDPEPPKPEPKLNLKIGDILIFEEVIGPKTGDPADANPTRRWAVRLTQVTPGADPLLKTNDGQPTPYVDIEWAAEDALPFPFCLSARLPAPDCAFIEDMSVAHGNVILVDHGQTVDDPNLGQVGRGTLVGECECEGSFVDVTYLPKIFQSVLKQPALTFGERLPKDAPPASQSLKQDPRKALPQITLTGLPALCLEPGDPSEPKPREGVDSTEEKWLWHAKRDLLGSEGQDQHFVVEVDNDGRAHLRFGDGELGQMPEACMIFSARYRVGIGPAGNVGADSITKIAFRNQTLNGPTLRPRNPLPAQGGTEAEPMAEVKLFAPGAFRKELARAITADDYAELAERNQKIQNAGAALRWTGSWYEAQVAIDPRGTEQTEASLLQEIGCYLYRYRRMGHDLKVVAARYVPLDIAMTVCVLPHYLRGHVEAALLDVFSNRVLPDGSLGFFHPDNLTFGEGIYVSKLIAAAQAVPGAESVQVTGLQRYAEGDQGELVDGILRLGSLEVAQLDNDPSFPEHGKLSLTIGGGR